MSILYLFGNGFDIAHDLETKYTAFRRFLESNHEVFLRKFESMYNIEPLDDSEPWYTADAQEIWNERVLKDLWKTFEEDIGHPNVDEMYDAALSLVDGMPSEGVKDTLDYYWKSEYGFSKKLQKYVLEWLMTIDTTSAECKKESLRNAQDAIVINFNYTDTVERIYGIKNVLHIHGGIPSCCSIPPIMGHGNKSIIESHRRKAVECQREFIEWGESINEAIANYCESLYKNTERIILSNEAFFSSIGDVDEIVCLGLSFGDVDIPYLERILQEIKPTVKWTLYYHKPESRDRLKQVFDMLGICKSYKVNFLPSNDFWDR